MSKTVSGTTTQFLYDGLNPVQELNGAAPPSQTANLLTGLRIDEYFARTDTATSTFLADALGSTVGLVGSGGSISTNYTYQPFGSTTVGGSANGNSYQFTGRENDGTGLYFYRARYYSPTFQRFIAQDPLGFGGDDTKLGAAEGASTGARIGSAIEDAICPSNPSKRFTPDQSALVDLVKGAKQRGGVSAEDAQVLRDWANELNLPSRGPESHDDDLEHIHIGPINHIPIK